MFSIINLRGMDGGPNSKKSKLMKPLNFASLFALFFVLLILFGAVANIENLVEGEFDVSILIGLIAIFVALILAFLTLKVRASEKHNLKRTFNLFFTLYSLLFLTTSLFSFLSEDTQLTLIKSIITLGLTLLLGFLGAKLSLWGISKTAV